MNRPQPTREKFPRGTRVRFLVDVERRYFEDVEAVALKGAVGVVNYAGDCDPYPTSYAYVDVGENQFLVNNPSRNLEIIETEEP